MMTRLELHDTVSKKCASLDAETYICGLIAMVRIETAADKSGMGIDGFAGKQYGLRVENSAGVVGLLTLAELLKGHLHLPRFPPEVPAARSRVATNHNRNCHGSVAVQHVLLP
jgi:hypothetical protein